MTTSDTDGLPAEGFWLALQTEIDIRNRRHTLAHDLEAIQPIERLA